MSIRNAENRVLAIDPVSRGFGYVIFEGPEHLIDWGGAHVRREKEQGALRRIADLLDRYEPAVVVLEDDTGRGSRRCARIRRLFQEICRLAESRDAEVRRVSPAAVRQQFAAGGATKEQIAQTIAARYPELAPRLPPHRKMWMSEDARMSIFDAAALALTYFAAKRN